MLHVLHLCLQHEKMENPDADTHNEAGPIMICLLTNTKGKLIGPKLSYKTVTKKSHEQLGYSGGCPRGRAEAKPGISAKRPGSRTDVELGP